MGVGLLMKQNTSKIYEVKGIMDKTTGQTQIDTFSIKLLFDFYLSKDGAASIELPKEEKPVFSVPEVPEKTQNIRAFRKSLKALLDGCMVRSKNELTAPSTIFIQVPGIHLYFNKDKVRYYGETISWLWDQVQDPDSLEGLCTLKTGEIWTSVHQQAGFLLALAIAAELTPPRETFNALNEPHLERKK